MLQVFCVRLGIKLLTPGCHIGAIILSKIVEVIKPLNCMSKYKLKCNRMLYIDILLRPRRSWNGLKIGAVIASFRTCSNFGKANQTGSTTVWDFGNEIRMRSLTLKSPLRAKTGGSSKDCHREIFIWEFRESLFEKVPTLFNLDWKRKIWTKVKPVKCFQRSNADTNARYLIDYK